jgi:chemotaxis signal transduction protein
MQEGTLNCVTGVGKLPGRLIILLDLERLLQRTGETSDPASVKSPPPAAETRSATHAGGRG